MVIQGFKQSSPKSANGTRRTRKGSRSIIQIPISFGYRPARTGRKSLMTRSAIGTRIRNAFPSDWKYFYRLKRQIYP